MLNGTSHPTDQELLMIADGELSTHRTAQLRAHLTACQRCRVRMTKIEGKFSDFTQIQHQLLDPKLPPIAGSRSQLKAQLARLAAESRVNFWWRFLHFTPTAQITAYFCVALLVVAIGGQFRHFIWRRSSSMAVSFEPDAVPNHSLTPGASRPVAVSDVCSMPHEEVVKAVPASLRQQIFQEYGIVNAHASDYEIDYLIAPGLGGVGDIHNLWPEPYNAPRWNAHVKDALEEHLHELVCSGKLDIPTAQRDIATNWIAAYKKYFRTDKPLPLRSGQAHLLGSLFAPRQCSRKFISSNYIREMGQEHARQFHAH